jgi:phage tail tape-measure protein
VIADADMERAWTRLAGLTPASDEQHAASLAWLRQFHHHTTAA